MPMYKYSKSGGPTGGETFTVTCFTCGMPSSKEWAQLVQSRPSRSPDPCAPFYPFLLQGTPPPGALFSENGTTYLCAFCHALIEAQWNSYEGKEEPLSPILRKYIIHKFICAVCGVETYRKRVRALPFQEFPFLAKTRQPGSITLGNNPLAVVCLDCSETLWAQSAEYDRWGLPVHKRHFNWMARPPPPEDSVEATVARLPSGETQLPRCPPTDPLVPPKTNEPSAQPEAIPPIKYAPPPRPRANSSVGLSLPRGGGEAGPASLLSQQQQILQQAKYCQQQQGQGHRQGTSPLALTRGPQTSPRKVVPHQHGYLEARSSAASSSSPFVEGNVVQHPIVVTVAPMSLQDSMEGGRKNSVVYTLSHITGDGSRASTSPNNNSNNKYEISTSMYGRTNSGHLHHESTSTSASTSHHHHSIPPHQFPASSPHHHHHHSHMVPYYSSSALQPQHPMSTNSDDDVPVEYQDSVDDRRYPSSSSSVGPAAWRRESPTSIQQQQHYPHGLYSSSSPPNILPNHYHHQHHHERAHSNFSSPPSLIGHPLSLSALFPQLRLLQPHSPTRSPPSASPSCSSSAAPVRPTVRSLSSPRDYEIYRTSSPSSSIRIGGPSIDHHSRSHHPTHHTSASSLNKHRHLSSHQHHHNSSEEDDEDEAILPAAVRTIKRAHSNPVTRTTLSPADANVESFSRIAGFHQQRNRTSPFVDILDPSGGSSEEMSRPDDDADLQSTHIAKRSRRDFLHPKKRHWEPTSCNSPTSSPPPVDDESSPLIISDTDTTMITINPSEIRSVLAKKRKFSMNRPDRDEDEEEGTNTTAASSGLTFDKESSSSCSISRKTEEDSGNGHHGAIDLSMSQSTTTQQSSNRRLSSTSKFSIAYLCKSETVVTPPSLNSESYIVNKLDNRTITSPRGGDTLREIVEEDRQSDHKIDAAETTSLLSLKKVISINEEELVSLKPEPLTRKTTKIEEAPEESVLKKEMKTKQSNFLSQLGLVPPSHKEGSEPKSADAIKLLKLREMRTSLSRLQAFSSKSNTKVEKLNSAQAIFLQTLGLRPCSETEKSRRENNADVICSRQIQPVFSSSSSFLPMEEVDADDEKLESQFPVCIKYPKYIPGTVEDDKADQQQQITSLVRQDSVLRIPVVHVKQHEIDDSEDGDSKTVQRASSSSLESILETSELHWKKSTKLLATAMNETKSSYPSLDEQMVRLEAIRKHISMQQSDLQGTEAVFVELENQILQKQAEKAGKNGQSLPKP